METEDLEIGDIIAVKGKALISEAIETVEGSPYSHIAGYVGADKLIEANGFRRTGYCPERVYRGRADVFRCDILTLYGRKRIRELAKREVGTKYSYLLLFVELIRYSFGIWLPYNPGPNRICSTLWAGIYREAGIDLCPGIKYPSPADIANSKLLHNIGSL